MKNMTTYFDQIDRIKPRSGQSPDELLKVRLALIDKFISEFHKKFVETHHEDLGDMAKIEANHLKTEYLQYFTTLYTEKILGDERDEPAPANDAEDDDYEEDSGDEDDGSPYGPGDPDFYPGERL